MPPNNITDKVQAKLRDGKIIFHHNHQPIGQMDLETQQVEMQDGYIMKNLEIFASDQNNSSPVQYAQDCDMDWCP